MTAGPELDLAGVSLSFGGVQALTDVTLTLSGHTAVGMIGPNGAGKSTLLNVVSGFYQPTSGVVRFDGEEITGSAPQRLARRGLVRTFQTARLLEDESVVDNVLLGRERHVRAGALRQLFGAPRHRRAEREWRDAAYATLEMMGLLQHSHDPVSSLSSATRRLVEIARVLQNEPQVLLLDEPAAGLDAGSRAELAQFLSGLPAAAGLLLVLVEHDVEIVRRSCPTSVALVAGRVLAHEPTDALLARADVRAAYFGGADAVGA
ncbi:MAG TPA: ATP-binding cassette domain-containing protein [Cellulomonas sp.]